eukprot:244408-Rhodomonas_salina.2
MLEGGKEGEKGRGGRCKGGREVLSDADMCGGGWATLTCAASNFFYVLRCAENVARPLPVCGVAKLFAIP